MAVPLDHLRSDDVAHVWPWLQEHLRWHLEHWSSRTGLNWDAEQIERRISEGRLVQREWSALLGASAAPDALVRVLRRGEAPLGIVHAEERPDRYLGLNVGVLSYLHVAESARGQGHSAPLVRAAVDWFAERGVKTAEVFVTAANEAAVRAYVGGGFSIIDHRMLLGIDEL
ncbi:MAG: GNAT family N-acetyltransferase [Myxococcota bacterium]